MISDAILCAKGVTRNFSPSGVVRGGEGRIERGGRGGAKQSPIRAIYDGDLSWREDASNKSVDAHDCGGSD